MKIFEENYEMHQPEYTFFHYPEEREELFTYSKEIAEYLKSEQIPNLVIIDRSSRPLYIGVKEYLKSKYPDEKKPNVYFMNPKGFKSKEDLTPEEIEEIAMDCAWKGDLSESPYQCRNKEDVLREFEDIYKKLMIDKEKPVLVFDTCIHSGNSLEPVKKIFKETGFSDIRIGAINPSEKNSKVQTDFYITTKRPEKGCYPFDRDKIIEKTFDHVYSKRSNDPYKKERSLELRAEITKIMKNFLAKE